MTAWLFLILTLIRIAMLPISGKLTTVEEGRHQTLHAKHTESKLHRPIHRPTPAPNASSEPILTLTDSRSSVTSYASPQIIDNVGLGFNETAVITAGIPLSGRARP